MLTSVHRGRRPVLWSRAGAECVTQTWLLNCFKDFKVPSHLLRCPCAFSSGCLQHQGVKNTCDTSASLTLVGEKAVKVANCWSTLMMSHDKAQHVKWTKTCSYWTLHYKCWPWNLWDNYFLTSVHTYWWSQGWQVMHPPHRHCVSQSTPSH